MNKLYFPILRSFLFVFLWLSSVTSFSQTGTAVTMTVQNVVQTAPTIFEYDIMLQNTGTTTLALQGYTFGMNHAAGMNGTGTITHAYVSRDVLLAALNPPTPAYTASSNHLRLVTSNTSAANAVPLPSGVSMRIATMRVSNTVSFPAGFNPSLTMQTILATGKTQCTATCMVTPPGSSYALNGLSNTPSAGSLQALNGVVTAPCFYLNPTAPFAVSVNATTPAICYGQSSGTAQLSLTGNGSALTGSYSDNGAPSIAYSTSPFTVSNLAAGAHTLSVTSLNGCTAAVNVTITQPAVPITSSFSATSCSSYTWNGITYTTSGSYAYTYTNAQGCDSVRTLQLSITNITGSSATSACSSYTWNGITYTTSGSYVRTYTNAQGCDSVHTLFLTIHPLPLVTASNVVRCIGSAVQLQGSPLGGVYSLANPYNGAAASYTYTYTDGYGCSATSLPASVSVTGCDVNLQLHLMIQGYYNSSSTMVPVLMNEGVSSDSTLVDTLIVELHTPTAPYGLVASQQTLLHTDGTASCLFPYFTGSYYIAGSYYVVLRHRNGIETWSASPVAFSSTNVLYDFANASSKAYDNSMLAMEPGVWALYSGDINQDENIDLFDLIVLEEATNNFLYGYYPSDVNGDGNCDLLDVAYIEPNTFDFVFSAHPAWYGGLPAVSTTAVGSITSTSAVSGGTISGDGGAAVNARGVCWSTSSNPTIALTTKTINGSGTGSFTSSITGLSGSTTYYVRAYATNSVGTVYGNQVVFTTMAVVPPTLSTTAVSGITYNSAISGGNISNDGGASVSARGVCWSTSINPTLALTTKTTNGSGTGSFSSNITGLTPSTTYYVRAYATNSVGTAYGNQVVFTTTATPAIGSSYQGGIVAYILQPGDPGYDANVPHGLIAAPSDQSTAAQWGCSGTTISGADGIAIGTGNQNTIDIMNGCGTAGIAARICGDLVLNGYSDWYLPSKDELNKLYLNRTAIGGIAAADYWSSSEKNSGNAWDQTFNDGYQFYSSKVFTYYVRAVRAF